MIKKNLVSKNQEYYNRYYEDYCKMDLSALTIQIEANIDSLINQWKNDPCFKQPMEPEERNMVASNYEEALEDCKMRLQLIEMIKKEREEK